MRQELMRIWSDGRRIERVGYVVGTALMLSGLVHLGVLAVSGGTWEGPLSMRKPATFGLSFGLTLLTVAWVTSFLRVRPVLRTVLLGAFTAACLVETTLVSIQAWRGRPSHFNFETPLDSRVSMSLAAGGAVIILVVLTLTVAALLGLDRSAPGMRVAVRFGFLTLIVSLASGAIMIGRGVVEARTGDPWVAYTTAGSLKPLHAVAMHAILVLPGLAWLLRFTPWSEGRRRRTVWAAVLAYAVLMVVVGIESFTGVAPLRAPVVPTVASGAALAVLAALGATVLVTVLRAERSAGR